MKKYKHLGAALAAVMITGTIGSTAIGLHTYFEKDNRVQAEEVSLTEAETNAKPVSTETADASMMLPNVKQITKDAMPSIVAITNESIETIQFYGREFEMDSESSGSGIIVGKTDDELLIATNNHVVEGSDELTVCFSVDADDEEDKLVSAQLKGTDSSLDLAVIAVKLDDVSKDVREQISVIQMGDSDNVEVGDWAIAIGNALGYGQSVTMGIVSALDREVTVSTNNGTISNYMLQTDAAINFGNSGGALLDANGNLIGINSAKASDTGVEGMGYAIPINTAKPIIEDLMNQTTRELVDAEDAGALSISVTNVSEEARQIYSIPSGAFVADVNKDGAADKAGMKQGDIITRLEKTGISSRDELLEKMQYYAAGETVEVTVQRMGDGGYVEKVLEVTLDEKPDADEAANNTDKEQQMPDEEEWDEEESDFNEGYNGPLGFWN